MPVLERSEGRDSWSEEMDLEATVGEMWPDEWMRRYPPREVSWKRTGCFEESPGHWRLVGRRDAGDAGIANLMGLEGS